ncbi:hypothetical protein T8S45_09480 [Blastomonas marina]|uniref:hypothetical protein n=1 Tax=Blastomonas marina TaxID=1867408 RepID=UPI002AC90A72|nr:hypothetical protein [Blastomonas marina]WPZ03072.1 hypothetical protein T8S45_09480 [Blastomonas marina]
MTLSSALSSQPFKVDLLSCFQAAEKLKAYRPAPVAEPWAEEPKVDQFVFKILFISVCHQMNWDVMQSAMAAYLFPDTYSRLDEFSCIKASKIDDLLSDYPKQERVRAAERARILRETAARLKQLIPDRNAAERRIAHALLEGPDGFYGFAAEIDAFTGDPFEKKPRVLAHDLFREKIIPFRDPENLKPAVEYHLIRLYLRSGRVSTEDETVREVLSGPRLPTRDRLVRLVREAVEDAMRQTALYAGLDAATLNYLEWQIGRAVCVEELDDATVAKYCLSDENHDLPDDIRSLCANGCPMNSFCRKLSDPQYPWLNEPHFQKAFY